MLHAKCMNVKCQCYFNGFILYATANFKWYFHKFRFLFYRATVIALCATCNVIVLVYDKTYRQSFGKIDDFHKIIIQHIDSEKVVVVLLGNKKDETHKEEVNTDEGYNKHKYLKTDFFIETSAKTRHNINDLFRKIEEEVKNKRELQSDMNFFQKDEQENLIDPQIQTYICPCTCKCICPSRPCLFSCRCCVCTLL